MKRMILHAQRGISLLELMVALAIGLVLLLALSSLMITANRASAQRSTSELLDESARQVFTRLEKDIYHAGYVDSYFDNQILTQSFNISNPNVLARYARQSAYLTDLAQATLLGALTQGSIQPIRGCNNNFTDDPTVMPAVCNGVGAPTAPARQSLQLAYQSVRFTNVANAQVTPDHIANEFSSLPEAPAAGVAAANTPGGRARQSCTALNSDGNNPIILNRYYLDVAGGETYSSLYCDSAVGSFALGGAAATVPRGGAAQPVTLGVDQVAFRYLMTPANASGAGVRPTGSNVISGRTVETYLHANQVQNDAALAPLSWAGVVGVEVCLVVAAEPLDGTREGDIAQVQPTIPNCLRVGNSNTANANFDVDLPRPAGDTRLYRRYTRTISMPNGLNLR